MPAPNTVSQLPSAKQFLDVLEKPDDLEKHDICDICQENFGVRHPDNEPTEHAVVLPGCAHVVGSNCIERWLSADTEHEGKNTCPFCRRELCLKAPIIVKVRSEAEILSTNPNLRPMDVRRIQRTDFQMDMIFGSHPRARSGIEVRATAELQHRTSRAAVDVNAGLNQSRGLVHLRQWLRRRLEPNPPVTLAEICHWLNHERVPTAQFVTNAQPLDPNRLRWTRYRELELYNQLRQAGAALPSLNGTRVEGPMSPQHENEFLAELIVRGAFTVQPGSTRADMTHGASIRAVWTVLREEGYVYGGCFAQPSGNNWEGWVGMRHENMHYPPALENHRFF